MPVAVELQNTGDSRTQAELVAVIEHVLSDRPGAWQVSIIGSRASDNWEMRIDGPNGFQRSYTLVGAEGEHRPELVRSLLGKILLQKQPESATPRPT